MTPRSRVQARQKKRVRRKQKGRDLQGYKSQFELDMAKELKRMEKKHGFHWGYEIDSYEYTRVQSYTPDFFITTKSGKLILVETKGLFVSSDRTKHLLMKEQHPELDIRLVFQQDKYLTKAKRTKYSDWARQNKIKYSIGSINKEWLDE